MLVWFRQKLARSLNGHAPDLDFVLVLDDGYSEWLLVHGGWLSVESAVQVFLCAVDKAIDGVVDVNELPTNELRARIETALEGNAEQMVSRLEHELRAGSHRAELL